MYFLLMKILKKHIWSCLHAYLITKCGNFGFPVWFCGDHGIVLSDAVYFFWTFYFYVISTSNMELESCMLFWLSQLGSPSDVEILVGKKTLRSLESLTAFRRSRNSQIWGVLSLDEDIAITLYRPVLFWIKVCELVNI